jgi:hypothetical protein
MILNYKLFLFLDEDNDYDDVRKQRITSTPSYHDTPKLMNQIETKKNDHLAFTTNNINNNNDSAMVMMITTPTDIIINNNTDNNGDIQHESRSKYIKNMTINSKQYITELNNNNNNNITDNEIRQINEGYTTNFTDTATSNIVSSKSSRLKVNSTNFIQYKQQQQQQQRHQNDSKLSILKSDELQSSLNEIEKDRVFIASPTNAQMEEINTKDLAQRISNELKRYSIPQAVFAQRVLCRSQGTLSDLLRNPKPWCKLKSGRETFRRMWKWMQEPESYRMNALRLAGI